MRAAFFYPRSHENGFEQTVVDEADGQEIQHEILNALGLPEFEKKEFAFILDKTAERGR